MQIEQCRKIILLTRLRERARRLIETNRKAGNVGVAQIYTGIDAWLRFRWAMSLRAVMCKPLPHYLAVSAVFG